MDDLLYHLETQIQLIDKQYHLNPGGSLSSSYQSKIKFHGHSILPPLMTSVRKEEMQMHKRQAMLVETRIQAKNRQKLLLRVQSIMNEIETKHGRLSVMDNPEGFLNNQPIHPQTNLSTEYTASEFPFGSYSSPAAPSKPELESHLDDIVVSEAPEVLSSEHVSDTSVEEKDVPVLPVEIPFDKVSSTDDNSEAGAIELENVIAQFEDVETQEEEIHQGEVAQKPTVLRHPLEDVSADKGQNSEVKDSGISTEYKDQDEPTDTMEFITDISSEFKADDISSTHSISPRSPRQNQLTNVSRPVNNYESDTSAKNVTEQLEIHIDQTVVKPKYDTDSAKSSDINSADIDGSIDNHSKCDLTPSSSTGTGTTFSSGEMNRTVIPKDNPDLYDSVEVSGSDVDQNNDTVIETSCHSNDEQDTQEKTPEKLPLLLSQVDLTVDGESPETTPDHLSKAATLPFTNKQKPKTAFFPPPKSVSPTLLMSAKDEEVDSEDDAEAVITDLPDVHPPISLQEVACNTDTEQSNMCTESTSLAGYMAHCLDDTIPSSITTLPHQPDGVTASLNDTPEAEISSIAMDDTTQSVEEKDIEDAEKVAENISRDRSDIRRGSYTLEHSSFATPGGTEKIRRNSYTLDEPSPALMAATKEIVMSDNKSSTPIDGSSFGNKFNVTSSMEDLRLRPVHRKLDYDVENEEIPDSAEHIADANVVDSDGAQHSKDLVVSSDTSHYDAIAQLASTENKTDHIHRYLQSLSQMPSDVHHVQTKRAASPTYEYYNTEPPKQRPVSVGALHSNHSVKPSNTSSGYIDDNADIHGVANVDDEYRSKTAPPLTTEVLLQQQMHQFELMKQQLVIQQQQQLASLLAEQERQQLAFQQEITTYQQVSKCVPIQKAQHVKRKSNQARAKKSEQSHVNEYDPGLNSQTSEGYIDNFRPESAPTPRVQFSMDTHSTLTSQSNTHSGHPVSGHSAHPVSGYSAHPIPGSQNTSIINDDNVEVPGWRSPAVLRHRASHVDSHHNDSHHSDPLDTSHTPRSHHVKTPVVKHSMENFHTSALDSSYRKVKHKEIPNSMQPKFEKVSALAKGFLTRKLMQTDRVQQIIKTIRDTAEFAIKFQCESPIKKGVYSLQDKQLQDRVLAQITAAMYEIHEIFFEVSTAERMRIIHQSRENEFERQYKLQAFQKMTSNRGVSAATRKAMERRRKIQAAEASVFGEERPKSAPPQKTVQCNRPKSRQQDEQLGGHIKRHYHHLMQKAMKPTQSKLSPRPISSADNHTRPNSKVVTEKKPVRKMNVQSKVDNKWTGSNTQKKTTVKPAPSAGAPVNRKIARNNKKTEISK